MKDSKILPSNAPVKSTPPHAPVHGGKRTIEEALAYVNKNWFPVNGTLLKQVQGKLKSGEYKDQPEKLLADIKQDFSLYTFCLRRLGEVVDKEDVADSPAEILLSCELEQLNALLDISEDQISVHKFNSSMKPQALCLKHALISSSTAEALAEKSKVDVELAFLCASARQLGVNLVAWNYPRIYANTLSVIRGTEDELDKALFKALGYSPLQLGLKAALGWNECHLVRQAAGFEDVQVEWKDGTKSSAAGRLVQAAADGSMPAKLRRFCEIGEAVARVNDPEHFPHAARDWETVLGELHYYLGPKSIEIISEKVEKNGAGYQDLAPALFKVDLSPEKSLKAANALYTTKLLEENHYVKKCPARAQDLFKRAYGAMLKHKASAAAIHILVNEVVGVLGFTKGCVYLVDNQKMLIVPMMRIGEAPLSRYRPLACADTGTNSHPVVESLSYNAPIVQEGAIVNGEQVSHVTGVFGTREKSGVLYLEMSKELLDGPDRSLPLLYFKALRQCLNDCLDLR